MQTRGATPLTNNHLKPVSVCSRKLFTAALRLLVAPPVTVREWNTSVSCLFQDEILGHSFVIPLCHRSSVCSHLMWCRKDLRWSMHILHTHGFIRRWEKACSCINLKKNTVRRSRPAGVRNFGLLTDFFSIWFTSTFLIFLCLFRVLLFLSYFLFFHWANSHLTEFSLHVLNLSIRRTVGNPKWRKNECVIFKPPANSEHLLLQGGGRPCQWEPLSALSTPWEQPATRGTRRQVCVLNVCYGQEVFILEWYSTGVVWTHKFVEGATVI